LVRYHVGGVAMSDQELLDRINAVQVSTQDLLDLAAACETHRREHPNREDEGMAGLYIAARCASNDPSKALAFWSRMNALATLLREHGAPGWTLPNRAADGALFAQEALLAAAAVHPLVQMSDNEWVFDRAGFLDRVLALSNVEGRA
jgi:hypothetical protein